MLERATGNSETSFLLKTVRDRLWSRRRATIEGTNRTTRISPSLALEHFESALQPRADVLPGLSQLHGPRTIQQTEAEEVTDVEAGPVPLPHELGGVRQAAGASQHVLHISPREVPAAVFLERSEIFDFYQILCKHTPRGLNITRPSVDSNCSAHFWFSTSAFQKIMMAVFMDESGILQV